MPGQLVLTGLMASFPLTDLCTNHFISSFTMAVPIMWFMVSYHVGYRTKSCRLYNHGESHSHDDEKIIELTAKEIDCIHNSELKKDLSDITHEKDTEISHLNKKPENLKTKIESIHAEI